MNRHLRSLLIPLVLLVGTVAQTTEAAAAAQPLTIDTGGYTCTGGVCDLGSVGVGSFFAGPATSVGGTGPTPYTWTVASGSLPADMLLESSYGVYSTYVYGRPITAGTTTFTLQVRDGIGDTARQAFRLTVTPGATPPADSVRITTATWSARQHRISISAADPLAFLTLSASLSTTGQPLCIGQNCSGALVGNGNGQYNGSFYSRTIPASITVTSDLGASARTGVTQVK